MAANGGEISSSDKLLSTYKSKAGGFTIILRDDRADIYTSKR